MADHLEGPYCCLYNLSAVLNIDAFCSSVDKAHLKLASAKAILRLSRYWENSIPADVFNLALRTVEVEALANRYFCTYFFCRHPRYFFTFCIMTITQINFRQARKLFLSKVHQYIKDRILDPKYACAFLMDIFASKHAEVDEVLITNM